MPAPPLALSFEVPLALLALALVPAAIAAYVLAQRRRPQYAARFTNLELLAAVVRDSPGWRRHVPAALALLALTALIVAAARPHVTQAVAKRRASVMLVTDVSGSMMATDVEPSRLSAARRSALAFARRLPENARLGLATFSNTATLNTPPTTDREPVEGALDSLRPQGGTAMGDGIQVAIRALRDVTRGVRRDQRPPAAIVLLSDGENTSGNTDPEDAAREARRQNIPIYAIALGTEDGTITLTPPGGSVPRTLPVPPDPETLRAIARTTGGRFFDAPDADELAKIYDNLGTRIGTERERREVTAGFAAGGALLLVAGAALSLMWFGRIP